MANDESRDDEDPTPEDRIRELKEEAARLTGGAMSTTVVEDCPPEIEEQLWEHVVAYEKAEHRALYDVLVEGGMELPAPEELADDEQVTAKLWEVIRGMALVGAYLHHTDHLSDRELYEHLWHDMLRHEAFLQPENPHASWHIDMIGSGSEVDIEISLRYYAGEEERREWARDFPEDVIPAPEKRPYDRDRHLPQWPPSPPESSTVV